MSASITHYGQPVTREELRPRITRRATALQTELNWLRRETGDVELSASAEAQARVACHSLDEAINALLRLAERLRENAPEVAHGPR